MFRSWTFATIGVVTMSLLWGCEGRAQTPSVTPASAIERQPPANWLPARPARDWQYIVLHHSATETGNVDSIDAVHKERKDADGNPWRGIGYHFVIGNGHGSPDGQVSTTFRWEEQAAGAHAGIGEYNDRGIGICLIGDFENAPPTSKQLAALKDLVGFLKSEYSLNDKSVLRHGDLKATACPGKLFPAQSVASTPPWPAARSTVIPRRPSG